MNNNQPIPGNIKIKVALDTQILAYLIDRTFPGLNKFIEILVDCPYVDIVCSRFATYEFVGVRKLEHYLRMIHDKSNSTGGIMNFSSALKYRHDWNAEIKYTEVFQDVKLIVESELKTINDDFGIEYADLQLHEKLWKPHHDLVLSSKISKEDSLVLVSSIFPDESTMESNLIFLTNDGKFYEAFCGKEKMEEAISAVFKSHGFSYPHFYKLVNVLCPLSNAPLNVIECTDEDQIKAFASKFIYEHLQLKNSDILLGRVIKCETSSSKPNTELLCFELNENQELNQGLYITIIKSDLSLIYNHPVPLNDFFCYGKVNSYPYKANKEDDKSNRISIKINNVDGLVLPDTLMQQITTNNNLVLIHPDSQ